MSNDNTSVLRTAYESFARGDVPAVLAGFDDAIVWDTPDTVRFGGTCTGPAAVGEFFDTAKLNAYLGLTAPREAVAAR